jgi:SAM-dependent methyltransferase
MSKLSPEFSPSIMHPFYFIRNGLKDGISFYAPQMKGKMMDFGCGSKPYRNLFDVEEYVGVDYYNEGHPHDNEQIDVFYDGKKIPLPNDYFDSVLSSEVFEHIFNLEEILREINRVMKKGGKLLVTCPFVWNEHEEPNDYARYTQFALKDIFARNGFEVVEITKSGNFVIATSQLWNLLFFRKIYKRVKNIFFLRWMYKLFFVFTINVCGLFWNKIFRPDYSMYLNTIILARKT